MRKTLILFLVGLVVAIPLAVIAYRKLMYSAEEAGRVKLRESLASRMQGGVFTDPVSGNVMPWRLYVPPNLEAGQRVPLVIAFHSGQGRGDDNLKQLDDTIRILLSDTVQGLEPVMVLAPQAARKTHWVDYPTFDPPFKNYDQREIPESENVKSAIRLLRETIANQPVDPARVYVTGISMGGEGSWDALTYYPDLFAAGLILNGAGDPRAMARVKDLPIRFFHGDQDEITPTANSRELDAALRAIGAVARYTELPGAGHNIREEVLTRENLEWLLSQRRTDAAGAPADVSPAPGSAAP